MRLGAWAMVGGCVGDREPPAPDTAWSLRTAVLPEGPGDVIVLDLDQREPAAVLANVRPRVEDAGGGEVELVERTYVGFSYGWAPPAGFVPGDYVLRGAADLPVTAAIAFTVDPFGTRALDGAALVGRAWELVDGRTAPTDVAPLGFAQGTAVVVVEAVDGDALTFSVRYRSQGADCLALRDVGAWDPERGALRWSVSSVEVGVPTASGEVTLPGRDLWLEVEWLADETTRAVGQAAGTVDTRALSEALEPGSGPEGACDLLGAFGFPCVPCTDDRPTCAAVQVVNGTLRETDPGPVVAPPLCGVDRVADPLPTFSLACEGVDLALDPAACGCAAPGRVAGFPAAAAALFAVARRRRPT